MPPLGLSRPNERLSSMSVCESMTPSVSVTELVDEDRNVFLPNSF